MQYLLKRRGLNSARALHSRRTCEIVIANGGTALSRRSFGLPPGTSDNLVMPDQQPAVAGLNVFNP